jgi:three-Cys-motif partner protein
MPIKDLHEKPFDESTIAKLEIFEDYAQAWIPTFVMQNAATICIFDFFAGTGYDKNGVAGSPIRILQKIKEQVNEMLQRNVKAIVYLNEFDSNKFNMLEKCCNDYLDQNEDVEQAIEIKFFNENFEVLFPKLLPTIRDFPSLVYLDQNGIKYLSDKYFLELEKTKQTDFLYFVSASYFWRFGEKEEFKIHLTLDMNEAKENPYRFIHRSLIKQLRERLTVDTKLKLYPFSLKKGANIHGIIFGASHPRAVQKFLDVAWKRNEINGEANFDIDDDNLKGQGLLFDKQPLTKKEAFKENLRNRVLAKEITDNFQAFDFVLEEGHLGRHAAEVLQEMKQKGEITFEGKSPLVTYDNVYGKTKRKVSYIVKK